MSTIRIKYREKLQEKGGPLYVILEGTLSHEERDFFVAFILAVTVWHNEI